MNILKAFLMSFILGCMGAINPSAGAGAPGPSPKIHVFTNQIVIPVDGAEPHHLKVGSPQQALWFQMVDLRDGVIMTLTSMIMTAQPFSEQYLEVIKREMGEAYVTGHAFMFSLASFLDKAMVAPVAQYAFVLSKQAEWRGCLNGAAIPADELVMIIDVLAVPLPKEAVSAAGGTLGALEDFTANLHASMK